MKKTLFILSLILAAMTATFAGVEIVSPSQVIVNGQPSGSIVDALANGADRPAMLDAVVAWEKAAADKLTAANTATENATAAGEAALTAEKKRVADILAAALADELATGDGPVAARIRQLQAAIVTP